MKPVLKVLRRAKLWAKIIAGREVWERVDVRCPKTKFGSGYGAWEVIVDGLNADSIIYSFGVGEEASFDLGLIGQTGCIVHAFDPTPKSIAWAKQNIKNDRFILHEYGLADFDGNVSFNPPVNQQHVSFTMLDRPESQSRAVVLPVKKLSTIMTELGHGNIDVLKMDIEGAEYAVIEELKRTEIRPKQILVEFHHRFPGVGVQKTKDALATLRAMGYRLYALAPSNEEYSFVHGALS